MPTPSLPTLYFNREGSTEEKNELKSLPAEILTNVSSFLDWGDLARLACVQSSWKSVVPDAAEFGGREATWELTMCLLGGEKLEEEETNDNVLYLAHSANTRGLQKNEPLAVKYLTQTARVPLDETHLPKITASSDSENECSSILPTDWKFSNGSANAGDADEEALLLLARCHLDGTGLSSPNPEVALYYLQAAYHMTKSVKAAHTLALIYEYPQQSNNLVPIDVYAAFEWFKAAAESGCVPSMAELALCYELGCGVAQSDEKALDWYMKAAAAGCSSAHFSVGEHYEEGRSVRLDHEEACIWYHRAAVMGEEDGVRGLRRLEDVARRVLPNVGDILDV
jgi:TPR repeat protein